MSIAIRSLVVVCVLVTMVAACDRGPGDRNAGAASTTLRLEGSSTMAPLVTEIAAAFRQTHPKVEFDVKGGGSGRGISAARDGTADIGMVSRALNESERDLVAFAVGRDGIALVVHRDNTVAGLTTAQIAAIFRGSIGNWKQVGGRDAPIHVITRGEGFSSLEVFTHHFAMKPEDIKASSTSGDNPSTFKALSATPNAITFISVGETERRAAAGEPIKMLAIDDVVATSENVRSGKYPVARSLTLVTKTIPTGTAHAFIEFALSPKASPAIKRYDFIPYAD